VIIETPDHDHDLVDLPLQQIKDVLWAYRERSLDLQRDPRFKYILIFKNQGEAAGASVEHSHSQLIATPIIPKRVAEELLGAKKYFDYKERCIFCDIIRQEINDQERKRFLHRLFPLRQPLSVRNLADAQGAHLPLYRNRY
jgi:UDPglucose--hexose-1-phosphate uridylyltransferase